MSSGYSANQYENAFKSQRLQNWCQPKHFKERPTAKLGRSRVIVNDRGHLLPGSKQEGSSWPDFRGTWELPARIPAPRVCPTARSEQGLKRLQAWGFVTPRPDTARHQGQQKHGAREEHGPADTDRRTCSAGERSANQVSPPDRPVTGGEREATPAREPSPNLNLPKTERGFRYVNKQDKALHNRSSFIHKREHYQSHVCPVNKEMKVIHIIKKNGKPAEKLKGNKFVWPQHQTLTSDYFQ
uniref:Protein Flattop n=1 Tax=Neogobius melanostomus TaxID=47308 RepID=A0A8C6TVB6_9GOBI